MGRLREGMAVDTKEKALSIAKLIKQSPHRVITGTKYLIQHGVVGLAERVYEEAVRQEVVESSSVDRRPAGSEQGGIKFSVIMPVFNVDPQWISKAVESVEDQVYGNWELCIADDCSTEPATREFLAGLKGNSRIIVTHMEENGGISAASNLACAAATGDYLVFMDNDDLLSRDALLECFYEVGATKADVVYSDQDEVTVAEEHRNPLFKPDWSPDLMLSQMYVGHLLCVRRALFEKVGGFRSEYDGSQDYDLVLRLMEQTDEIRHIDKVLYSWRAIPSSTTADPTAKPYAQTAGLKAIQSYLDRTGTHGEAFETDSYFVYDVRYPLPPDTLASIIIPTKDHADDLKKAVDSIYEKTTGIPFEIIILDNRSEEPETLAYFEELRGREGIRVLDAPYEFNWSKLNNQGIAAARGNVIVCLNNDVIVEEAEWLRRLAENALRDEIGVVGGLLLYPDGTIQHAGVVVGMGGWADHVYKAKEPVHYGSPYISPMVKRNVMAVTGACMAFSRDTLDRIGGFDENFIVCGSDVELCIRAYRYGYRNLYDPRVVLTHFESKTRDASRVPEIDFTLSRNAYAEFREGGDPYYNSNLDPMETVPSILKPVDRVPRAFRSVPMVGEVRPIRFRRGAGEGERLNILLPSVNEEDVFGGIATALKFYERLGARLGCPLRIIVLDGEPRKSDVERRFAGYELVLPSESSDAPRQIVPMVSRDHETLEVTNGDVFVFTIWWGAFCIQNEYANWSEEELRPRPFVYLIQDFEPGFYAWSSRYMLADSTYRTKYPQIAVFNSGLLKDYFDGKDYQFAAEYFFEPTLNAALKERLLKQGGRVAKRKRVLVYGRPSTDRNAFEIIVEGLREWVRTSSVSAEWDMVAAGETFEPVYLGKGRSLVSVGKLTLDDYATTLAESAAGISLMVSPHPSYPPLEMASFGVKVITNKYGNKDLSSFSDNVVSLDFLSPQSVARALEEIATAYEPEMTCGNVAAGYLDDVDAFAFVDELAGRL